MVEAMWMREAWAEWAAAVVLVAFRVAVRTLSVGFRGWQGDDYLILVAIASYTITVLGFYFMDRTGTNQGLTDEMVASMSREEIRAREIGSQWDVASWLTYATLIWACKGCMLFLYRRLTFTLWQQRMVKVNAYICVITYAAVWLAVLLNCIPLQRYWQVKPPPGRCVDGLVNIYTIGITNIVTDALIFAIPIPLILKISLPMKKKIYIILMFCSGIFVMAVTALRLVITLLVQYGRLTGDGYDLNFMLSWASRENFTAVMIVNIPIIIASIKRVRTRANSRKASQYTSASHIREVMRSQDAQLDSGREDPDPYVYSYESSSSNHGYGCGGGVDVGGGEMSIQDKISTTVAEEVERARKKGVEWEEEGGGAK